MHFGRQSSVCTFFAVSLRFAQYLQSNLKALLGKDSVVVFFCCCPDRRSLLA